MPHGDPVDHRQLPQVDLHPLPAGAELHILAVSTAFIAVRDERERADRRQSVAAGDELFIGENSSVARHHELWPGLLRLKIGNRKGPGCAGKEWWWEVDDERDEIVGNRP